MSHNQNGSSRWRALDVSFCQMQLAEGYTICVCAQEDFGLEIICATEKTSE